MKLDFIIQKLLYKSKPKANEILKEYFPHLRVNYTDGKGNVVIVDKNNYIVKTVFSNNQEHNG